MNKSGLHSRYLLDRSFTGIGFFSIILMITSLLIFLIPIFYNGSKAFVFKGTVEYRRLMLEQFGRGNKEKLEAEINLALKARQPIYDWINSFEKELKTVPSLDDNTNLHSR